MQKIYSLIFVLLFSIQISAQAPQAFKYQTIIRDNNGEILSLQELSLKCLIRIETANGVVVYSEKHSVSTNTLGLINLNIGEGEVLSGSFQEINWGAHTYFLEQQFDLGNTEQFQSIGTVQLLSVPYSLHSNTANGIQSMTTQGRDALVSPILGMQIYNTDTQCLNYYTGNNWFETCGQCTPQPTEANAGEDQIGLAQNWVMLQGNQPIVGEGYWSIIYGVGGQIVDFSNPNTVFYGQPNTAYILQWEIETECITSVDQVNLEFGTYVFACGDTLLDTRDQQKYGTVVIGTQCWMTENLNIGTKVSGNLDMTNNNIIEKYCYYDEIDTCAEYGGLYQWDEVMQYSTTPGVKGICPTGWHLPKSGEWTTLVNFLGEYAGLKAKEASTRHWTQCTNVTNSSGLSLIGGAYRSPEIIWNGMIRHYGFYWTSTNLDYMSAMFCGVCSGGPCYNSIYNNGFYEGIYKVHGLAVRCVKNN